MAQHGEALSSEVGKVRPDLLARFVFSRTGVEDPRVLVGPAYGEDSAIIDMRDFVLVVHSDPITEAVGRIGWLAVHVACNDVAVRGAKPEWLLPVILLPEGCPDGLLDEITAQIDQAAREIGAAVVGGHTERCPRLDRPIISMTAVGTPASASSAEKSVANMAVPSRPAPFVIKTTSPGLAPPVMTYRSLGAVPTAVIDIMGLSNLGQRSVWPPTTAAPTSRAARSIWAVTSSSRPSGQPSGSSITGSSHSGLAPLTATSLQATWTASQPMRPTASVMGSEWITKTKSPMSIMAESSP